MTLCNIHVDFLLCLEENLKYSFRMKFLIEGLNKERSLVTELSFTVNA